MNMHLFDEERCVADQIKGWNCIIVLDGLPLANRSWQNCGQTRSQNRNTHKKMQQRNPAAVPTSTTTITESFSRISNAFVFNWITYKQARKVLCDVSIRHAYYNAFAMSIPYWTHKYVPLVFFNFCSQDKQQVLSQLANGHDTHACTHNMYEYTCANCCVCEYMITWASLVSQLICCQPNQFSICLFLALSPFIRSIVPFSLDGLVRWLRHCGLPFRMLRLQRKFFFPTYANGIFIHVWKMRAQHSTLNHRNYRISKYK